MSSIEKDYTNRHMIGSFAGLHTFLTTKKNKKKSASDVRKDLENVDAWTLFRPIALHPPTRKTLIFFPNWTIGIDLMSMQKVAKYNKNTNFILLSQDLYTRFIYYSYLKDKSGASVVLGLKKVFRQIKQRYGNYPKFLFADQVRILFFYLRYLFLRKLIFIL